jgi:hypothetical protein
VDRARIGLKTAGEIISTPGGRGVSVGSGTALGVAEVCDVGCGVAWLPGVGFTVVNVAPCNSVASGVRACTAVDAGGVGVGETDGIIVIGTGDKPPGVVC